MESGFFLDSKVEILRHNIIGHVCGIGYVCGIGPISESFKYIYESRRLCIDTDKAYIYIYIYIEAPLLGSGCGRVV